MVPHTLRGDLTCADEVTFITHEDDGSLGLSLSQEKSELSSAVETTPVSHWKHQDTHLTLQSRQVLRDRGRHMNSQYCSRYSVYLNIWSLYLRKPLKLREQILKHIVKQSNMITHDCQQESCFISNSKTLLYYTNCIIVKTVFAELQWKCCRQLSALSKIPCGLVRNYFRQQQLQNNSNSLWHTQSSSPNKRESQIPKNKNPCVNPSFWRHLIGPQLDFCWNCHGPLTFHLFFD